MREPPYIFLSGAASNVDKNDCSFDLCATQYMSHFRDDRELSVLPVRANFNSPKFKNNKPRAKENHDVGLLGVLENIDTELSGEASLFHIAVDTINFIRPVNIQSSKPKTGFLSSFASLSLSLTFSAFQDSLQPTLALNSILIAFLLLLHYPLRLLILALLLRRPLLLKPVHLLGLSLQKEKESNRLLPFSLLISFQSPNLCFGSMYKKNTGPLAVLIWTPLSSASLTRSFPFFSLP